MPVPSRRLAAVLSTALALLAGCTGGQSIRGYTDLAGGQVHSGEKLLVQYRCGSCHVIPGIRNADGLFGPPLVSMGRRTYIAGEFANDPENLVRWIMSPESMKPGTTMPTLGLSEQQARDVAAYLNTLK